MSSISFFYSFRIHWNHEIHVYLWPHACPSSPFNRGFRLDLIVITGRNLLDNLERIHIRHTGNSQHETDYLIKLVLQMGLALSTIFRADFNRFSNESCAPTNWLINIQISILKCSKCCIYLKQLSFFDTQPRLLMTMNSFKMHKRIV